MAYYDKEKERERKRLYRLKKLAENPNFDKEWYAKHRDYYREYDAKNKETRREQQKVYNTEHKEEISKNKKRYNSTQFGRAVNICSTYTQADKEHNRGECTITPQWIVENIFTQSCHYCGEADWHKLGCDRIDNDKPHTADNVVCCCNRCNTRRWRMDYKVFYDKLKKEYEQNQSKSMDLNNL